MATPTPKSVFMTVRVTGRTRLKFHARAKQFGNPSDVLRELIEAFIENRLTIVPPVNRKESLYVTRNPT